MAIMVPSTINKGATQGERLLFTLAKDHLPDDWVGYHEPMIGQRKPDYVFIIPHMGILVLEVKDYKKSSLLSLNTSEWVIQGATKKEIVRNPLDQAREYAFAIANKLKVDRNLLTYDNGVGKLKFSYAFGTVFTNLTRLDVVKLGIDSLIPNNLIICGDEIRSESAEFDSGDLFEQLVGMFPFKMKGLERLTEDDINTIRFHLFPEVRIGIDKAYDENDLLKLKSLKAMSIYQETLAKQMGEGHRLIRGVAGSGKTLVLVARAKLLTRMHPEWKILICCFNVILSRSIKSILNIDKQYENIEVLTYHEFLYENFRVYEDSLSDSLANGIEDGYQKAPVYDAVLVDEGQDLEAPWVRLLSRCVNRETGSLLIAEDRAQDIYRRKTSLLKDTGLDFRGRSRVLSINYRNSQKVLEFAWNFYKTFRKEEHAEDLISPESTKRKGKDPIVRKFSTFKDETYWIAEEIKFLVESGVTHEEILVLYRVQKYNGMSYLEILSNHFKDKGIPFTWSSKDRKAKSSFRIDSGGVKLMTIDSAKGLDYKAVFIIACDLMPLSIVEDKDREVSLMYIGMTRTTDYLYLSYTKESEFTSYLGRFI
jgi:hypothetical protein